MLSRLNEFLLSKKYDRLTKDDHIVDLFMGFWGYNIAFLAYHLYKYKYYTIIIRDTRMSISRMAFKQCWFSFLCVSANEKHEHPASNIKLNDLKRLLPQNQAQTPLKLIYMLWSIMTRALS